MKDNGLTLKGAALHTKRADGKGMLIAPVDARFPTGEIAVITGSVGAGKSALIHLMAGLFRPTEGEILADGKPVSRYTAPHLDRWRRSVGIVFQKLELLETRTVMENVMLPLVPRDMSRAEKQRATDAVLDALGLISHRNSPVSTLSGGERQKTAVARALVGSPRYVLADEPSAHQDARGVNDIMSLFIQAAAQDAVVIIATHDPRITSHTHIARQYHLEDGRIGATT